MQNVFLLADKPKLEINLQVDFYLQKTKLEINLHMGFLYANKNQKKSGNMRDYSNVAQLVCLSNLENLNAEFIEQKIDQTERLVRLNKIAIRQMNLLLKDNKIKKLK